MIICEANIGKKFNGKCLMCQEGNVLLTSDGHGTFLAQCELVSTHTVVLESAFQDWAEEMNMEIIHEYYAEKAWNAGIEWERSRNKIETN